MSPTVRALVLIVAALGLGYGVFMTIDAIRRPRSQYPVGQKKTLWCWLLALSLIAIFTNGSLFSLEPFVLMSIGYHVMVRRRQRPRSDDSSAA